MYIYIYMSILSEATGATGVRGASATVAKDVSATSHDGAEGA